MLIAPNVDELQLLLNNLYQWCSKWRLQVNVNKTKIMHFHKAGHNRDEYEFKLGEDKLSNCGTYRYLGLEINETMNFSKTVDILCQSSSRALGSVISKYFHLNGLSIEVFQTLFEALVCPVMDYGSAIWGTKKYQKCETIQNRAMRTFLGVTKATPVVGMYGELGWLPPRYRHQISCVKLWYRLCLLEKERVTHRVADWDYLCNSKRRSGWHHDIKDILTRCNLQNIYESRDVSNLSESRRIHSTKDVLMNDFVTEWKCSISDYSCLDWSI